MAVLIIKKSFKDVQVGDLAFSCDTHRYEGHVLAKGTLRELIDQGFACVYMEDEEVQDILNEPAVAVTQNPDQTLERFENFIYLYDFDPSSVYCKKRKL